MAVTVIGGNKLSAFYSTALFVPWSSSQAFVPFAAQTGNAPNFQYPFVQANTRESFGLYDNTDSFSPFCRIRTETEQDFDALLSVFFNPDNPPRGQFSPVANYSGFQLYLTFSNLSLYPTGDPSLEYYWIPRVLAAELPHRFDVRSKPAKSIEFDLHIFASSPAFFLPNDFNNGSIARFIAYCQQNQWSW